MRRLSAHVRRLIVKLAKRGFGPTKIRREISALESIVVSRITIRQWIQRYNTTGKLVDLPRRTVPAKLAEQDLQLIDDTMYENSETSAEELRRKIRDETGKDVSKSTVNKARRQLGWVYTGTAYCQLIRDANKIKRLEYSQRCLDTNETFDDVIFTDEKKNSNGICC